MDCVFCKIVKGEIPSARIYDNDQIYAFLDIGPVSQGHCLLIPKRHVANWHDCPAALLGELAAQGGKIAQAMMRALKFPAYNILCNNGREAGQLVEHLHFHIIPRRAGDSLFTHWPTQSYEPGAIEKIAHQITTCLS